ncbi:MAG: polyphosphate:AMP phosphotransferase, partial [Zoogloea sp.]|nr:polyphosphate:AMP phosphotransferase [Zoogloea sp.]
SETFKRYKITPDDWRSREKWPLYEPAVCDMIDRTSTSNALWTLVEADNKYFARVKILRTLVDKLEAVLE